MNFFVETLLIFFGIVCIAAAGCIAAILSESKIAETPVKDLVIWVISALVSASLFILCIYSDINWQHLTASNVCMLICPALPFGLSICAIVRIIRKRRQK